MVKKSPSPVASGGYFLFFLGQDTWAGEWVWHAARLLSAPGITAVLRRSALVSNSAPLPSMASSERTWGALCQSLKSLCAEFAVLSDKAAQQVRLPIFLISASCSASAVQAPQRLPNECSCAVVNILRADERRTMLWRSWISSWTCCSHTEWVCSALLFVRVRACFLPFSALFDFIQNW